MLTSTKQQLRKDSNNADKFVQTIRCLKTASIKANGKNNHNNNTVGKNSNILWTMVILQPNKYT